MSASKLCQSLQWPHTWQPSPWALRGCGCNPVLSLRGIPPIGAISQFTAAAPGGRLTLSWSVLNLLTPKIVVGTMLLITGNWCSCMLMMQHHIYWVAYPRGWADTVLVSGPFTDTTDGIADHSILNTRFSGICPTVCPRQSCYPPRI